MSVDAAPTPRIDARSTIDAADATIDATPPIDAVPQPVAITAIDNATHEALQGAEVVFQNPDGTVIEQTTDSAGTASATVAAGASVTVIEVDTSTFRGQPVNSYLLRSVEGVQPGDAITIDALDPNPFNLRQAFFSVHGANYVTLDVPEIADAAFIWVVPLCDVGNGFPAEGANTTSISVEVSLDCTSAALWIIAFDASNAAIATIQIDSQSLPSNGTLTITQPWSTVSPNVLNLDHLTGLTFDQLSLNVDRGDGNWLPLPELSIVLADPSQDSVSISIPPIGVDYVTTAEFHDDLGGGELWTSIAANIEDLSFDIGGTAIPWIDQAQSYDSTSRQLTWTESAGTAPDAVIADSQYIDSNNESIEWTIVAPGDVVNLTVPTLPTLYAGLDVPIGQSNVFSVTLFAALPSLSYDVARTSPMFGFAPLPNASLGVSATVESFATN